MTLAAMVAAGEDDLICDYAQYYHIYDWRGLPLPLATTLASGLPGDSRCKRRMAGLRADLGTLLLARIADSLSLLLWRYSEPGTPKPPLTAPLLIDSAPQPSAIRTFANSAAFDRELAKYIR